MSASIGDQSRIVLLLGVLLLFARTRLRPSLLILLTGLGLLCPAFLAGEVTAQSQQRQPRGRSVTLGDLTAFEVTGDTIKIAAGNDQVRVLFYRPDLFRIWLGPDGTFSEPPATSEDVPMVVFTGKPVPVRWQDAGEYYRLQSEACMVRVYKRPLRFALFDRDDATVIWQEERPLSYGPSTVQSLKRTESEHFFGCGMQNGYFSHRDTSVNIRTNYGRWNDGTTSNPVPFYLSTAGYGAFRNTFTPGRYDFLEPLRFSHDEARFDCWYFFGPDPKRILEGYTLVTGRPFLPPRSIGCPCSCGPGRSSRCTRRCSTTGRSPRTR